jgi:hypothetical protein
MASYGKRPATSPKENMAKNIRKTSQSSLAGSSHESDLNTVVKLELLTLNGKPYLGQITDDELVYIWVKVLNRKREELFGITSTKTLTRNIRATYKLVSPTPLEELFESGLFTYEKFLDDGSRDVITGKILGYGAGKPAEIGDVVKISVKTNFLVEPTGVLNWLKLYGVPTLKKGDFQTNATTGFKNDIYEVEIVLKHHIPEYLPMYGQKVQVSYPGIPRTCNRCFKVGHLRRECQNIKKEWVQYIVELLDSGLNLELIGSWKNAVKRWKDANGQSRPQ